MLGYETDILNRGLVDYLIKTEDVEQVRIGEIYLDENKKPKSSIKIIDKEDFKKLADGDRNAGWVLFQLLGDELKTQKGDYKNFKINRKVRSTPNNRASSRSHAVIDIVLKKPDRSDKNPHLIICDLAGVENAFACNDYRTQINFFTKLKSFYEKKGDSELKFEDFLKSIDWFRALNLEKNEELKSSNYEKDYEILK